MADFEKNINELDGIIKKLNSAELSLDESIKLYEQGMKLTKTLNKQLDENEKRVMLVMEGKEVEMDKKDAAQTSLLEGEE